MRYPFNLISETVISNWSLTENTPYEIKTIDAVELLCPERIDLAAKLAYIEARETGIDMSFAKEVYRKHIEAFSEGSFSEPGDENKTSLDQYYSVFDELIDDFKISGFDKAKSLVPVGKNGIILDGAHRVACAIYFRIPVTVIEFQNASVDFDYNYFRGRRLSEEMLRYMTVVYCRYAARNLYCACLWPVSDQSRRPDAIELIRRENRIVYDASVSLGRDGMHNFMLQIYRHQDWVGDPENHFSGVNGKVDACFAPGVDTGVVVFEGGGLNEVLKLKEKIREVFGLGKHAIHISDSNNETRLMAELLLNDNSLHALNYGHPDSDPEAYLLLREMTEAEAPGPTATLLVYGIGKNAVLSAEPHFDVCNPRTYFVYENRRLPALREMIRCIPKESAAYSEANELIRKGSAGKTVRRIAEDARTKFVWFSKKKILRFKQIAMAVTTKIGVYEILHNLRKRK